MITLNDLRGRWRMTRSIEDRRAGVRGHLDGEARWSDDGVGLRQHEAGLLQFGTAAPMQAHRVYLWRGTEDGLCILFEDGRPFHTIAADRLTDRHLCPPDIYDVSYSFSDWPVWRQSWTVVGPRKDTVISTEFMPWGQHA